MAKSQDLYLQKRRSFRMYVIFGDGRNAIYLRQHEYHQACAMFTQVVLMIMK